jgi:hypothetical protein
MVPDVFYRGYRIVSDVEEIARTGFWKGKAAVVEPADTTGVERVHPVVATAYFRTEKAAIDFIVAEAKKWIDARCGPD